MFWAILHIYQHFQRVGTPWRVVLFSARSEQHSGLSLKTQLHIKSEKSQNSSNYTWAITVKWVNPGILSESNRLICICFSCHPLHHSMNQVLISNMQAEGYKLARKFLAVQSNV